MVDCDDKKVSTQSRFASLLLGDTLDSNYPQCYNICEISAMLPN